MKILAHIHTFNDENVIDLSLAGVRGQSRAVDRILVVDNGSSDSTLDRDFGCKVTVLRHDENLGTSGAVRAGMRFAIENGFDWIWILDADSSPRPDALEKLLDFYEQLPEDSRKRVLHISSLPVDVTNHHEFHGMIITSRGFVELEPPSDSEPYECLANIWSGCLYRCEAIRHLGLPSQDFVLDWGERSYGYHGMIEGLRCYVVPDSRLDHNIDGHPTSATYLRASFGPFGFKVMGLPPIRLYYIIRNGLYFWLHEFRDRSPKQISLLLPVTAWVPKHIVKYALTGRWKELGAMLRGLRDGLLGRMDRRY